jgi:hypothetical protein
VITRQHLTPRAAFRIETQEIIPRIAKRCVGGNVTVNRTTAAAPRRRNSRATTSGASQITSQSRPQAVGSIFIVNLRWNTVPLDKWMVIRRKQCRKPGRVKNVQKPENAEPWKTTKHVTRRR